MAKVKGLLCPMCDRGHDKSIPCSDVEDYEPYEQVEMEPTDRDPPGVVPGWAYWDERIGEAFGRYEDHGPDEMDEDGRHMIDE